MTLAIATHSSPWDWLEDPALIGTGVRVLERIEQARKQKG